MDTTRLQARNALADSLWLSLAKESIFITGGSGLFGRAFLKAMQDANRRLGVGVRATVLTRNAEAFIDGVPAAKDEAVDVIEGDVTNFAFPARRYSRVLHMATTSANETYRGEDQLAKFQLLINGTERVLKFCAVCGAKRLVFTSSGVVYGAYAHDIVRVRETYAGAPETTDIGSGLAQGKRAAEYLCTYYAERHGFQCLIARCFSFVGPGLPLNIHYAIGNFIRDALFSEVITVKGDGVPIRSFLSLSDLVVWIQALLINESAAGIYNVGSDEAISILDLASLVRDLLHPGKPIVIQGAAQHQVGNFSRSCYVPDISRARDDLGVGVWTALSEAIIQTANHVLSDDKRTHR